MAAHDHSLRQSIPNLVPVHHGFSSAANRWRCPRGISFACTFLSTAATVSDGEKVYGGLRDAGDAAARHRARGHRQTPPRSIGHALSGPIKGMNSLNIY